MDGLLFDSLDAARREGSRRGVLDMAPTLRRER
jgi:hypothetical protein